MEAVLFHLPSDMKMHLKLRAFQEHRTMREVITLAISDYLDKPVSPEELKSRSDSFDNNCLACGGKWSSRKENPAVCPYCKAYHWKTGIRPMTQRHLYKEWMRMFNSFGLPTEEVAKLLGRGATVDKLARYIQKVDEVSPEQVQYITEIHAEFVKKRGW